MWRLSSYPRASQPSEREEPCRQAAAGEQYPVGSQHRGETTCVSSAGCTSQGTRECEVEAKCVILYFTHETQACLQPYKNTHKPISASWFVFSLYFLGAENRVCPQTAFVFSSCKFYLSAQL